MIAKSTGIIVALVAGILAVLGLAMISSTAVWHEDPGKEYTHLHRQAIFFVIGIVACIFFAVLDYRHLRRLATPLLIITCVLLALCYLPGIGVEANGAKRWVRLLGFQIQPSEIAKITLCISLASYFARYRATLSNFLAGAIKPGLIAAIPLGLILFEKDLGTTAALGMGVFALFFIAGVRLYYLAGGLIGAYGIGWLTLASSENRMSRLDAWQDLEAHKLGQGLQQYRSLQAFNNGGIDGVGFGNGAEKHGFLPYCHTDFIFPMIGEELGLMATLGVIFGFVIILIAGTTISLHACDHFGKLLAFSLTATLVSPAIINIAVATALIPNTGLPLPYISYGGTNLIFSMIAIGILLSISIRGQFITDQSRQLKVGRPQPIRL